VKQADLVMLLALHPEWFSRDIQRVNFDFYEPRTWHGSSLSPGIHALVAARLGEMATAERYFEQTAAIDLAMEGNASVGVHLAALGSLWMAAVFGFGGVRFANDSVRVTPHLPAGWERLGFRLLYRGRLLSFAIDETGAQVEIEAGPPLTIDVTRPERKSERAAENTATGARGA
jgi:trehalose/maltose hydrolase-like predicted phosphorylase